MKPLLIAFEGLDGVGKSSLAQAMAKRLAAPLMSTPPQELRAHRAEIDRALGPSPIATQLFYASTVVLVSQTLRTLRTRGSSAIVDRYWASTLAYAHCRTAHLGLDEVARALEPVDLTVYVELDEVLRRARLAGRARTTADEASLRQAAQLHDAYESALRGPWSGALLRHDNAAPFAESAASLETALRSFASAR